MLAPSNKAHNVIKALVSGALNLSEKIASDPVILIHSTGHLDKVVEDTAPKGATVATKKTKKFCTSLKGTNSVSCGNYNQESHLKSKIAQQHGS